MSFAAKAFSPQRRKVAEGMRSEFQGLTFQSTERELFRRKPGFRTYYRIGVVYSKRAAGFATYQQVGDALGISKQNAYTESVIALGKLLYRLVRTIEEELNE